MVLPRVRLLTRWPALHDAVEVGGGRGLGSRHANVTGKIGCDTCPLRFMFGAGVEKMAGVTNWRRVQPCFNITQV